MPATATGVHFRSYQRESALRHTKAEYARLGLVVAALLVTPYVLDNYWLSIVNTILIAVIGAVGLNILVGFTGQISLAQWALGGVGALFAARLIQAGWPAELALVGALAPEAVSSYLSGLIIGAELAAALERRDGAPVMLLASGAMAERYTLALERYGISPIALAPAEAKQRGLALVSRHVWSGSAMQPT
jgi:ABC-type branched-subunit amino acid transport system permease subunit